MEIKVLGIVSEYNPFHNGHLYHIEKSKKELGAQYTVAVMSGNFVMRGEPALFDKYTRAKAATFCGVDLVLELPVPYALSSAEYFAFGAVSLLDSMNLVDYISFGSESGDIEKLDDAAEIFLNDETVRKISELSKKGINLFDSYKEIFPSDYIEIINKPNNILGINYLKALKKLNSKIVPFTLKRVGSGYNDISANGEFASATAIREFINSDEKFSKYLPDYVYSLLKDKKPVKEKEFDTSMVYSLRMKDRDDFLKYADVSEGLHNLIKRASDEFNTIGEIAMAIKSKRYSYTRIKRILYNSFLDIPKDLREKKPGYSRVLAFNEKGRELMGIMREKSDIPVITNIKKEMFEEFEMLKYDTTAGKIFRTVCRDYKERIIF